MLRRAVGAESFHVLDTTHPAAVRRAGGVARPRRARSSSSRPSPGTTLETRCHLDFFWELTRERGESFVAITDPGSELEALAGERGFRAVFHGEPTIGGRYSALSPFGIVPAALMGVDVEALLDGAVAMAERCRAADEPRRRARPRARSRLAGGPRQDRLRRTRTGFGLWLEQLLAESTGKQGKGLVPAPGRVRGRPRPPAASRSRLDDDGLGAEFYRWEFATAVAGADPRHQPVRPAERPGGEGPHPRRPFRPGQGLTPDLAAGGMEAVENLLAEAAPPDYVAIQAFVDPAREGELAPLVERARATGCVVTVGLGPALPALDGPAAQGRPADGALRPGRGRPGRRASDPRAGVRLPPPDPRPGRRRPRRPARARAAHRSRQTGGPVKLGIVGLGRMGGNMTERLRQGGHEVETYARTAPDRTADSLVELATRLEQPRVVWLMIPAGDPTEMAFETLLPLLEDGDVLVDGGNSNFRDSIRRAEVGGEEGRPLPRRRRLRRHLGPRGGLLHHGRRRRGRLRRPSSRRSPRSRRRAATRTSARRAPGTS